MSWQDAVFTTGQGLFAVALIPALLSASKPPRATCWTTGLTLFAFAFAFLTLDLWGSSLSSLTTGALWVWLALQNARRGQRPPKAPPYQDTH